MIGCQESTHVIGCLEEPVPGRLSVGDGLLGGEGLKKDNSVTWVPVEVVHSVWHWRSIIILPPFPASNHKLLFKHESHITRTQQCTHRLLTPIALNETLIYSIELFKHLEPYGFRMCVTMATGGGVCVCVESVSPWKRWWRGWFQRWAGPESWPCVYRQCWTRTTRWGHP